MQKATLLLLCLSLCSVIFSQELKSYNVDPGQISVSGISSGAYMAVQLGVCYSSVFMGVGVVAGGPFFCANATVLAATTACMSSPEEIFVPWLVETTETSAEFGYIDPVSAMASQRVWIFSGTVDTVVNPGVVHALVEYYETFLHPSNISTVFNVPAEHSWITNAYGGACSHLGSPYINNCNLDAAGEILQWVYGPLNPPTTADVSANIFHFSQSEYVNSLYTMYSAGLQPTGYIYVPTACQSGKTKCRLHFFMHGCEQTTPIIGTKLVEHSGLNQWAETNHIIVVYPQAAENTLNPKGCWDWWGYTGPDYASNSGVQMMAIYNMMKAIVGQ